MDRTDSLISIYWLAVTLVHTTHGKYNKKEIFIYLFSPDKTVTEHWLVEVTRHGPGLLVHIVQTHSRLKLVFLMNDCLKNQEK